MLSNKTAFTLVIGSVLIAGGCRQEPRQVEASPPKPISVKTRPAAQVEWASFYEATGTVRAKTAAVISSRIMGYVQQVRVSPGDRVAAGQTLVVLDARDLETAVRQAKAAHQEAASATLEVQNAIYAAKASLDLAEVTYRRISDLFEQKSVSKQEYDEAAAKRKVAQASYEIAVSKQNQLASKIQHADEAVQSAEILRGYSEIHSPFAGTVTDKRVEEGAMAMPGTPLLTIEQAGRFRMEAAVDEGLLDSVRLGQVVAIRLDAVDRTVDGRVSEIEPSVDTSSRTFIVKIDLPGVPGLRSGVFGRVRFPRASRRTVVIPGDALAEQGQLQSVMVVESGVARSRAVTTGEKRESKVEVLSGLGPGEIVVSPRPPALLDGSRVEVAP